MLVGSGGAAIGRDKFYRYRIARSRVCFGFVQVWLKHLRHNAGRVSMWCCWGAHMAGTLPADLDTSKYSHRESLRHCRSPVMSRPHRAKAQGKQLWRSIKLNKFAMTPEGRKTFVVVQTTAGTRVLVRILPRPIQTSL